MTGFGPGRLVARATRVVAGPGAFAAVIVLLCALAAAIAPVAADATYTSSLRHDLDSATNQAQHELQANAVGGPRVGHSADPSRSTLPPDVDAVWGRQQDQLASVHASMLPTLRRSTEPAQVTTVLEPTAVLTRPGERPAQVTTLELGFDPRFADRIHLEDGALPGPFGPGEDVEIVLSVAAARSAEWEVGDLRTMSTDQGAVDVRLTGVFTPLDPTDPFWSHTASLLRASRVAGSGGGFVVVVQGYADPSSWPTAATFGATAQTSVWFTVDSAQVDAASAPALAREARELTGSPLSLDETGDLRIAQSLAFTTRVPELVESSLARNAVTRQAFVTLAAGPLGATLAALVLAARLLVRRLEPTSRLLSARGAVPLQVRGVAAASTLAWLLPAAAVGIGAGVAVAARVWGGAVPWPPLLSTVAVTVVTTLVVTLSAAPGAAARAGRARLAGEVVVVTVAAASLVAVLQRGAPVVGASPDAVLVVEAPLLALVGGLATVRLLPPVLRQLSRVGRRGRGLTAFLGPTQSSRRPAGGSVTALALVLGLSVAVFSGSLLSTLRAGIDGAARSAAGGDLRLTSRTFTADQLAAIAATPGVRASSPVAIRNGVVVTVGASHEAVSVIVVDADALRTVQADVPGAVELPASLSRTDGDTVPVVASQHAARLFGDDDVSVRGHDLAVVATQPDTTALANSATWILVDVAHASEVVSEYSTGDLVLADLDPGASATEVEADLREVGPADLEITTPAGLAAAQGASPDIAGVQAAVVAAVLVSGLAGALTIVMTLALGATARTRLLGVLGALGLTRREARALTVWEVGPLAVGAVVAGTVVGLLLPRVVVAATDLRPFTGLAEQSTVVDPVLTLAIVGAFCLVVAAAVAVSALVARTSDAVRAVRSMEEG